MAQLNEYIYVHATLNRSMCYSVSQQVYMLYRLILFINMYL